MSSVFAREQLVGSVETNKPDLQMILVKWQRLLRVQDWRVLIQYARPYDMGSVNKLGEIHYDTAHKEAVIKIMDADEWPDDVDDIDREIVFTVGHELAHLHFAMLDLPEDKIVYEEQTINIMVGALMELMYPDEEFESK
jgi:hypothetical protein